MRLEVAFADRVGIASEILAVLARRRLNVVAVEVEPPHVYIDVPGFADDALDDLRRALAGLPGFRPCGRSTCCPGRGGGCTSTRCSTRWPIRCWRSTAPAASWSPTPPPAPRLVSATPS